MITSDIRHAGRRAFSEHNNDIPTIHPHVVGDVINTYGITTIFTERSEFNIGDVVVTSGHQYLSVWNVTYVEDLFDSHYEICVTAVNDNGESIRDTRWVRRLYCTKVEYSRANNKKI